MKLNSKQRADAQSAIAQLQAALDGAPKTNDPASDAKATFARDTIRPLSLQFVPLALDLGGQLSDDLKERALEALTPFCANETEKKVVFSELSVPRGMATRVRHLQHHSPALDQAYGEARLTIAILTEVLERSEAA